MFAPPTFSTRIVFNFAWDDYKTEEKLKQKLSNILGGRKGVLQEMCKWGMLFSKSRVFIYAFTKQTAFVFLIDDCNKLATEANAR